MRRTILILAAIFSVAGSSTEAQQQPCAAPLPPASSRAANIFTESQEVHLGDAIAEQLQRNFRIIDDDALTEPLRRIGQRIARHLPPTQLNFRFFMIDLPDINAFVLPGGRIYVSRKLIAFAESEDELGGVLAHEIGHLVARQHTITITRQLKDVLGVTKVTDRADIFDKYNQLLENASRKPEAFQATVGHEDADQIVADRIGLFAAAGAGYDPQASAKLWDRYAETKGKTGSFFSDLFGVTRPEARRLREMTKALASLPAACVEKRPASSDDFRGWQAAVLSYTNGPRKESLHGVLSKTSLQPQLRGEISHLRFSPDGRFVLAQDESGIDVLSRDPFTFLFRIPTFAASRAQFTPDSQGVVFYNADLRVELWGVAERKLKEAHELFIRVTCLQAALSPDGRLFACLENSRAVTLFEVATGKTIFQRKDFYQPAFLSLLLVLSANGVEKGGDAEEAAVLSMGFSTDGHYFAASQRVPPSLLTGVNSVDPALVVDLQTRVALTVKGNFEKLLSGGFAFIGPDRLVAFNVEDPKKSALIALPEGNVVSEFPIPVGKIGAVTRGNYVVMRPFAEYAAAVIDIGKGEVVRGSESTALDIYDGTIVSERLNGELGLYSVDRDAMQGNAQLPSATFGALWTAAVSPDLKWLAVSERTRGAVWDLESGKRVLLSRAFRSGVIANGGMLSAEFPKFRQIERQSMRVDLNRPNAPVLRELKEGAGERIRHAGEFIAVLKSDKKGGPAAVLEIQDSGTLLPVWTRSFPYGIPDLWISPRQGAVIAEWGLLDKGAQAVIKANSGLQQKVKAMKEPQGDYLLEIMDSRSGIVLGYLPVETGKGSFRITQVLVAGDWVVLGDDQNRALIYSLAAGEKKGQVFGSARAVTGGANPMLAVENEGGQLAIYDLTT